VVVLADGDPGGADPERSLSKVLTRIANGDDTVISVGVGSAVDPTYLRHFADAAHTDYVQADTPAAFEQVVNQLIGRIRGQVTIAYDAPPGAAGDPRAISVRLQGFDGEATGSYSVPATTSSSTSGPARLRLRVKGGTETAPLSAERSLGQLDDSFAGGVYQVFVGLGVYPPDVAAARFFDSWLANAQLRLWARTGRGKPPKSNRSVNLEHVRIANELAVLVDAVVGDTAPPIGPGLALLAAAPLPPDPDSGDIGAIMSLDTLAFQSGPHGGTADERVRWGLALTAAEARVVGARSTSDRILDGGALTESADTPPDWLPEPAASAVRGEDWNVIVAEGVTGAAWLRSVSDGTIYGVTGDGAYVAKGAEAKRIGAYFDKLHELAGRYGYYAGFAFGAAAGGPLSVPFAGLAGLLDETLKLWCFSTVVMNDVGEGIESGEFDAEEALDEASDACHVDIRTPQRNFAKAFTKKYISGLISEAASNKAADAIKDKLGPSIVVPPSIRDRLVNGVSSGGVEAGAGETPIGPGLDHAIGDAIF